MEAKANKLSAERLLQAFLVCSILLNVFLVFHANSLNSQVSTLSNTIETLSRNVGLSAVVSQDTTNKLVPIETVKIKVITDKRCSDCDTSSLVSSLKQVFTSPMIIQYDYSSETGKKLYDESGLKALPIVLFESNVTKSGGYNTVQRYLSPAGNYLSLAIGSTFDPSCYNSDGTVRCSDPVCSGKSECRTEISKKLDIFVMSHCPYGVQALNAVKEVLQAIPDVKLAVNYIATYDNTTGTFTSLHGQTEVDDDLRELCVMKYYPDTLKYMGFIWCRNNDIQNAGWDVCAKNASLDVVKIKACAEGQEGKELLINSIKISESLNIQASPTWYTNNKYMFSGLDAQTIKTAFCRYNAGAVGCEKTLSSSTPTSASAGSCAT